MPRMLKLSGLNWCPVSWLCAWMERVPSGVPCSVAPGSLRSLQYILLHSKWLHTGSCILPCLPFPLGPCPWVLPVFAEGYCFLWSKFVFHTWYICAWCFPPGPEYMGWLCVPYWVFPWGRLWLDHCHWKCCCLVLYYQSGYCCYHFPLSCNL